jgi:hypothetical protein
MRSSPRAAAVGSPRTADVEEGNVKRQLREDLERLHEELNHGAAVDPESRRLLAELANDIESLLERSKNDAATADASLAQRLRDATERFEESHPDLTAVVGRIADMLARMGI